MSSSSAKLACPTEQQLDLYLSLDCPTELKSGLDSHLESCSACRWRLAELRAEDTLLGEIRKRVEYGDVRLDATAGPMVDDHGPDVSAGATEAAVDVVPEVPGYRIVGKLGEGGMGVVWEAEQLRPHRHVALKVVKGAELSPRAQQRFEHEAQVLALLEHPGIASLYEVGSAPAPGRGTCYFAMELVRGRPLSEYANDEKLSTAARLKLMAEICDGVQHAHTRGVIHRDLKSRNILVGQNGHPKILDFGVARLTDCDVQVMTLQTDVGQLIGTLPYMSPEQLDGDSRTLDTRTDVFSLGVTLYELLCGRLPYPVTKTSLSGAARMIREDAPRRPSSIDRTLRGDIETIVLKALEKDRERRYQSATELAEDIRRYLDQKPIMARPPTLGYQLGKLVVRYKALFATLALLTVSLLTFSVVISILYVRADEAREQARAQAVTATQVAASLMDLIGGLDPYSTDGSGGLVGASLPPDLILDRAGATIMDQLTEQPEAQITLLTRLVEVNLHRGRLVEADALGRAALERARSGLGEEHLLVARAMQVLAQSLSARWHYEEAESLLRDSLAMRQRLLGNRHVDVALSLHLLAGVLLQRGDYEAAELNYRHALAILQAVGPSEELGESYIWMNVGDLYLKRGDYEAAHAAFESAMHVLAESGDGEEAAGDLLRARLALTWRSEGDPQRALTLLEETLAGQRVRYMGPHPRMANTLRLLGETYRILGDLDQAERAARESLAMSQESLGDRNILVYAALAELSAIMQEKGKWAEAEDFARQKLELAQTLWLSDTPPVLGSLYTLSKFLLRNGKLDEAEDLLRQVVDGYCRNPNADPTGTQEPIAWLGLAEILDRRGDPASEACYESALDVVRDRYGEDSPLFVTVMLQRVGTLRALERYGAVVSCLGEALEHCLRILGQHAPRTIEVQAALGHALMANGEPSAAVDVYRDLVSARREVLGNSHAKTQAAIFAVVLALEASGQIDAIRPWVAEALAVQQRELLEGRVNIGRLHDLVQMLNLQGDTERLEFMLEQATSIYERSTALPEDHLDRSGAPLLLGLLHLYLGNPNSAELLLRECVDLRARHFPPDRQWMTAYAESVLGECIAAQGRLDEAEPILLEAWEAIRIQYDEHSHRTREVAGRVLDFYETWNRPDLAEQFRARLSSFPPP